MRAAFGIALVAPLLVATVVQGAPQKQSTLPSAIAVGIFVDGAQSGSGIYLKSGLVITAAHLTSVDARMSVKIAGGVLPATVLKQGSFEDVDLSLLSVDQKKLPPSIAPLDVQICDAPPWPGDPVLVMDSEQTRPSRMVWPRFLPYTLRSKLPTWIADVATTGNSGSGVFDPNHKCLLGIMSRKYMAADKDIAKYFVPAAQIREFVDKLMVQ